MRKLDHHAIAAMRERLLEVGGAPSRMVGQAHEGGHPLDGDDEARALFDATFEAMFIMLCADGATGDEEKLVLHGAVRELTAEAVSAQLVEHLVRDCAQRLHDEGIEQRLDAIAALLRTNPTALEAAFVLAAVMAHADATIAEEERDMLHEFGERLGLDATDADRLLGTLADA